LGALLWGVAVDRLRRRGVGPRTLLGLVAMIFIAAQLALILRLPLPSCVPWIVVAAVGAGTVLSYAILAEYFPTELAGRANAALNLFHIGGAFVVQYMTGLVVQLWAPTDGHYPEIAYQTAFAFNVGLQIVAAVWFALTWVLTRNASAWETGFEAFTLKPLQAFELGVRQPFLNNRESKRQKGAANQF
jgi:MFS family permease